ncbi:hypothetical protein DV965_17010, partial [Staphylococcus pseudintermedius]
MNLQASQNALEEVHHHIDLLWDFPTHIDFIDGKRQFLRRLLSDRFIDNTALATYHLRRIPPNPKAVKDDPMLDA